MCRIGESKSLKCVENLSIHQIRQALSLTVGLLLTRHTKNVIKHKNEATATFPTLSSPSLIDDQGHSCELTQYDYFGRLFLQVVRAMGDMKVGGSGDRLLRP
jgi:hypothetical protein